MHVRINTIKGLDTSGEHFETTMHTTSGDFWYFFYHIIQEKSRIECVQEFRQHQNITTKKKHTKSKSQVSLLLPADKAARNCSNITQFHLEIKDKKHQESQSYHPK